MYRTFLVSVTVLALLLCAVSAQAGEAISFDRMKELAGTWKGKSPEGKDIQVTYELISGGTALLERMSMDPENMATTYYPDGQNIVMTHYCMAGNQPRMKTAASSTPQRLVFEFVDSTNLASADAGHMHQLVVAFKDSDHMSQEWTWTEKGQQRPVTFELQRVR